MPKPRNATPPLPKLIFSPVDATKPYSRPQRHYEGDAGYDLTASNTVTVYSGGYALIPSNVRVALPTGVWAMIAGRSSTFFKRNLLVNQAIIDNGFRGELWAMVFNPGKEAVTVRRGERLIQLILFSLVTPELVEVKAEAFPTGDRGEKGFGSTGGLVVNPTALTLEMEKWLDNSPLNLGVGDFMHKFNLNRDNAEIIYRTWLNKD